MRKIIFQQDTRHYKNGQEVAVTEGNRDHLERCVGRGWAIDSQSSDSSPPPVEDNAEHLDSPEYVSSDEQITEDAGSNMGNEGFSLSLDRDDPPGVFRSGDPSSP